MVGWEIPSRGRINSASLDMVKESRPTLSNLLALVDLGNFLLEELVTLLADLDDLLTLQTQSYGHTLERVSRRAEGSATHQ